MSILVNLASSYIASHLKNPEYSDENGNSRNAVKDIANSIEKSFNSENQNISNFFQKIISYPLKIIASFIFAPFLMLKVILFIKTPIRRIIAGGGFLIAILTTYTVSTWLGKAACFWFIKNTVGWFTAFGFLIGTTFSIMVTVIISVAIFNFICFIFLKMSNEEVIDYLKEISS